VNAGPSLALGLGLFGRDPLGASASLARMLAQAELAERTGFDSVWVPEGHFEPRGLFAAPLLLLAAVAARTRRIRLGTTSYLLTVRHPLRVAEDVAVLDQLSGGRVILGVGRGFRQPLFDAFGVRRDDKRARFEAALGIVLAAWRGEPVAPLDQSPPRFAVTPRPAQTPHPPIWVAAFGPKAVAQAGRLGFPYLASPLEPLSRLAENYARHRAALPASRADAAKVVPVIRTVFATRDATRAREVREALAREASAAAVVASVAARRAGDEAVERWALVGEPTEVAERIHEYRERIGLTHLIARSAIPGVPPDEVEASLRLLTDLRDREFCRPSPHPRA
jgi:alkanesulfonate monooxygenase SsuD/methylene tetrahydromethanopterin reductase-like flavin-dependent oxidoreductase (luciferase family)